ncbi:MAG: preprotein translocase subunit YajC [Gemmatimonadaceae bacterium]|nr:preprotein translocase subunit YajC [Gemmatimonadaceae bacterium]
MPFLFQMALIVAIFYFVLLRPQQQQRKKHQEMINALRKGDDIVTAGGIIGKVVQVKEGTEKSAEDRITIESGDSKLVVERGRIAKVVTATGSSSSGE